VERPKKLLPLGDFYACDFALHLSQHNFHNGPFCGVVSNTVESLINDVNSCRTRVKCCGIKKSDDLDRWRSRIAIELKAIHPSLEKKFQQQATICDVDVWIEDVNGKPILTFHRNLLPPKLHQFMNELLTTIWKQERLKCSASTLKKENTRGNGFKPEPHHYSAHAMYRMHYELYKEVDLQIFARSVPMWVWSELMLKKLLPQYYKNVSELRKKQPFNTGGYSCTGLVFNFTNTAFHHDKNDICPAIISYLSGPYVDEPWSGGAFLVRCMGLRICVRPGDVLIFESRLFHEVESVLGVRFSVVSYCKKEKLDGKSLPRDMTWLSSPHFGFEKELF